MADNILDGSPSYRAYVASLAVAGDARLLQTRQDRHVAPSYPAPKPEPEVVREMPLDDEDESVLLVYSDGSVVRRWQEFSPATERVDTFYETVRRAGGLSHGCRL